MLITFKTKHYANITLFGDVAQTFLKILGHSNSVPGAIRAEDVPSALARLQQAVANAPTQPSQSEDDEDDKGPYVSLKQRALPLIELFESAAKNNDNVMWE
ncbi:DUF1840 domain-containing protein [Shewanella insulae]|uniref:DUF1840 domain-containing protein n=1 Tax=Shewanella insulae TaxID=2681496 RepID=UPI001EFD8E56|nr:DUF1840 domain-containing protein [Shewanella insulae]MCG9756252.1 DUF1840 domain-containing protein [Shewanella insulae]